MKEILTGLLLIGSAFFAAGARAAETQPTLEEKVKRVWNAGRAAPEQKAAPEQMAAQQKAPEVQAFTPAEIFKATDWDEKSAQSFALDALLNGDLDVSPYLTNSLRLMPPEFREGLLRGAAAFAKAFAGSPAFSEEYLKRRKDVLGYEPAQEDPNIPVSPQELLKIRLRGFLAETADVDFSAGLELKWSRVYFVEEKYEAKPRIWKKCFRLGPKLTAVARSLASAWLVELEPKQP